MNNSFPLVSRELSDPIGFINKPIYALGPQKGVITTKTFLQHVHAVAAQLADKQYAINLCENRYLFLVSFCAVIVRKQTSLLPPNKNVATQEDLQSEYKDTYILHDNFCELSESIYAIDINTCDFAEIDDSSIPLIDDQHLACISFTSGSTGQSSPNLKYWQTLHKSTAINYQYMIPETSETLYQLATMPAQHMWGLETSILMPMFYKICMSDAKPLFPQDIIDTLEGLPTPRLLVSTPVHLRALSASLKDPIPLFATLCATSPLTPQLASAIETAFECPLHEVYGCSEVGSMAVRRTKNEKDWLRFSAIEFVNEGEHTYASAAYLPDLIQLQDRIVLHSQKRFALVGRASDMVKIAGKRGSLFEINQVLLRFEGLKDGIVLQGDTGNEVSRLCAIVALEKNIEKLALREHLRKHLDSAFVPRPIYVVDALPRESNGKLLKAKLTTLLTKLKAN